jgi:DNA-binding protein YbaB
VEQMSVSAMHNMLDDLKRTLQGAEQTQRKVLQVRQTATSEDKMIKAVVGPRGQLVHLEIDPRVYRKPNATALAATIVATVREAAEGAMTEVQRILADNLPSDLSIRKMGSLDLQRLMRSHDAELAEEESDVELG